MDNENITGRWALVTGGSSGLGVDFARELASRGCNIVLVARREGRLKEVRDILIRQYGVKAEYEAMDLVPEEAPGTLYGKLKSRGREIDILVNNAGFGLFGEFLELDWNEEQQMLRLDMLALTHLTKLFARDMVQRNTGYILQVSSIGAYQPSPTYATYSAAKSYVLNFGEALNYELKGTGVSCTVISPGIADTEFLEVSGQKPSLYQRLMMMESREVASAGINAMVRRKSSVVPGLLNKITIFTTRFIPRTWMARSAYYLMVTGQKGGGE